jgi:hypothetical protein
MATPNMDRLRGQDLCFVLDTLPDWEEFCGQERALVLYMADWVAPCEGYAGNLLDSEMGDVLKLLKARGVGVGYVDVGDATGAEFAGKEAISQLPTTLFYSNGDRVDTMPGVPPVYNLLRRVEGAFGIKID